jgi:hypothetical protein
MHFYIMPAEPQSSQRHNWTSHFKRNQQELGINLMAAHFRRDGSSCVKDAGYAGAAEGGRFAILDSR